MEQITWNDFAKIDIRIGTIISAEFFEEVKNPAFKLQIDFGAEIGILKTSAQITDRYDVSALPGKQIVAVVNFPKKQIANMMSECLVLGAVEKDGKVTLLSVDDKLENGLKIG